ncbi:amidohydrolase [Paenibacillus sp. IB182496]|uniref:Amidohydrolase n=1 Tax=Paenibacillus sabuli TaxID=2772509 RepID=A0A927GS62_9BACL|nr:amidohydrolase family protein [Paenibacillus sabuli]MBD2845956.1 amidohydrolase [Paenibacillus sabuli]
MESTAIAADARKRRTKPAIIDCDIHIPSVKEEMLAYLPRHYREQIDTFGMRLPSQGAMYLNGAKGGRMQEQQFPNDGKTSSILEHFRREHLDKYNIAHAILTGIGDYGINTTPDPDYAAALCRASNDYGIDHFVSQDPRVKSSIMIPKQDPLLAAQEIDRVGDHPGLVQVIVSNGAEKPYGNRFYYPIYEACVRHNLPFAVHVSMEGIGINHPPTGAGHVNHYIEYRMARTQIMMAHLASMIFEGVFVRFPELKFVMIEAGMLWVAPYMWRMDQDWKALRSQTPWVSEPPSEYVRRHVRFTSQPLELPPDNAMFEPMMNAIFADTNLLFASDYPHWDFDSPLKAFPKMSAERRERIFYANAAELYGLPSPAGQEASE